MEFREGEVRDDMELGGLWMSGETPFKQRLERSRSRQYRFSKKKSGAVEGGCECGGWMVEGRREG